LFVILNKLQMKRRFVITALTVLLLTFSPRSLIFPATRPILFAQDDTTRKKVTNEIKTAGSEKNLNTNSTGTEVSNKSAQVQDHNSSRSNKSSSVQDHNSSRSNKSSSVQDHNSSRSNKSSSVQDHNSSRSNKSSSVQDHNSSRSNKFSSVQDHNSSRSNKSSTAQDYNSSRSNKTSRAQDYNSSRSNKTASALSDLTGGGDPGNGDVLRATNHNSTRSNRTNNQVKGLVLSVSPSFSTAPGKSSETEKFDFSQGGIGARFTADYYLGKFGIGITNGLMHRPTSASAINDRLSLLGYEPASVEVTSSPGQSFFLLAGPVFSTGNKLQLTIDGKAGMFVNNPGTARAISTSGTGDVINVSGSSKVLKPGFSSGIAVSYNFPGAISLGILAGYSGNGNSVSQFDSKTRETTVKNFYSQQFYTGVTVSVRLQGRKIVHRDLAARGTGNKNDEPVKSEEDESEEVRRDTVVFVAEKIEFRQNIGESRRSNEGFRLAGNNARGGMIFTGDLDGDAIPDMFTATVADALNSLRKYKGNLNNVSSNPLYESNSGANINPVFVGSETSGTNPVYSSSNTGGNNPLYNGGKEVTNPLASGGNRSSNPNPLFEPAANEANNPLYGKKAAMLTTGVVADVIFPSELDVATVPGGNLKNAVWLDCSPAGKAVSSGAVSTVLSTIRHVNILSCTGGHFVAEVIAETNGAEYDAVITGKVRSINDGKKGILSIIK
jgi:hypothetical protein